MSKDNQNWAVLNSEQEKKVIINNLKKQLKDLRHSLESEKQEFQKERGIYEAQKANDQLQLKSKMVFIKSNVKDSVLLQHIIDVIQYF